MILIDGIKLKQFLKDPSKRIALTWISSAPRDDTIVMTGKTLLNIVKKNQLVSYSGPLGIHGSLLSGIWIDSTVSRSNPLSMDQLTIDPIKTYMLGFQLGYDYPKLCLREIPVKLKK